MLAGAGSRNLRMEALSDALPPELSTRDELRATKRSHEAKLRHADRVLDDFRRMDGSLVLVRKR